MKKTWRSLLFYSFFLLTACGGNQHIAEEEPLQEEEGIQVVQEVEVESITEEVIPTADQDDVPILDEMGNWKVLEDFHMEMAMTYHPAVDEGKIEVAKENAGNLAQKAQNLAGAKATPAFDNEEARKYIDELVVKTQDFANLVSGSPSDEQVVAALEDVHNTYHSLEKAKKEE